VNEDGTNNTTYYPGAQVNTVTYQISFEGMCAQLTDVDVVGLATRARVMPARTLAVALVALCAGALLPALGRAAASAKECRDLVGLTLGHVAVKSAEPIDDGIFRAGDPNQTSAATAAYSGLPAFCRVQGVSTPVAGSEIGFEVWLPRAKDWTRRLHMVGNGAYSSRIYYAQMVARIRAGDVAVATDTGHQGGELTFAIGHPQRIVDFAHRAVHESVLAAKALTNVYYGASPAFSYFSGCSTGGYQALMAAQRHPRDFDGIIAGDPGNNRSNLNLAFLWNYLSNHPHGDDQHQIVPNEKLLLINHAIVASCDRLDGVTDGVVSDPRSCHFDLQSLLCSQDDAPNCLTHAQIDAVTRMYAGPKDARTGKSIYPGYSLGSEGVVAGEEDELPGWSAYWSNPKRPTEPDRADFFRYWVFNDPHWDWWKFNWGSDIDVINHTIAPVFNATSADLHEFESHHGKLILFMGAQDPVGAADEAIDYYQAVEATASGASQATRRKQTLAFLRLYMVPGMAHCAGGPGATHFSTATRDSEPPVSDAQHDMAIALEQWVEKGVAPERLIATKFDKEHGTDRRVLFQRPLCVYPQVARYTGGPTNSADSFACEVRDRLARAGEER
jgi:feruloyl esterase